MTGKNHGSIQKQLASPGNALQKYRFTVVGDKGYLWLLFYELIVFCTGSLPLRLGGGLRIFFYSLLLGHTGRGITVGVNCSMRRPHLIQLGNNVILGDNVALDVKTDGKGIILMDGVRIDSATIFSCPGGSITIGNHTRVGARCRLGSLQGLTVGKDCIIGNDTYIVGAGHAFAALDRPIIDQPLTCKGANTIGDRVTIGQGVTILDGVSVGSNVKIASGSLVNRDVPPDCSVSGVPARIRQAG